MVSYQALTLPWPIVEANLVRISVRAVAVKVYSEAWKYRARSPIVTMSGCRLLGLRQVVAVGGLRSKIPCVGGCASQISFEGKSKHRHHLPKMSVVSLGTPQKKIMIHLLE